MPSDLHHDLSKEAPSPSTQLDMSRVWRRGLRLRRRKYLAVAAGVATVVVVVAGGLSLTGVDRNGDPPPVATTDGPEGSDQHLIRLRAELYSQLRELRTVMRSVVAQRDELLSDLEALGDTGEQEKVRGLKSRVEVLDERIVELADEIEQTQERIAAVTARIIADRRFEAPTPEATDGQSREYIGFRPGTSVEGDKVVMPLTFIDGSVATLVADRDLGLQDMVASIYTAGGLGAVDRTMDFRYRDGSTLMHQGPLETYEGVDGSEVELWHPGPDMPAGCPNLVFRFGEWFVGVRTCVDELSRSERQTWARSLRGQVTDDGFLVLSAQPPLVLQEAGGHDGPQMIVGMERANWIEMRPGRCHPADLPDEGDIRVMSDGTRVSFSRVQDGNSGIEYDWFATWCEDRLVRVQISDAYRDFAMDAAEGLRMRNVDLAE